MSDVADIDADDRRQAQLIARLWQLFAGLHTEATPPTRIIETHISRVLLAGALAYKFKKPVQLGFLDFSTLALRQHFAQEELRLNRRLAAQIYLDVVPIRGTLEQPSIGGLGPVLDYAVRMRRFPETALLTRRPITAQIIDAIAARLAGFHAAVPAAAADSEFGTPEQVLAPMLENFAVLRDAVPSNPDMTPMLAQLERWTRAQFAALSGVLLERRRTGNIRECHGDLHRGNIAVVDGEPLIFDCIEFSASLRWIDRISELAFLLMDLQQAGETAQARRLLNRYLALTGDYAGLSVLRFYLVYRALVRAKVTAIGIGQHYHAGGAVPNALHGYLHQALACTRLGSPRMVILCGLSGSGKTSLAAALSERLPLVHIRSDVERKRLFGLPPEARTDAMPGSGIYLADVGERTYGRLLQLARTIIASGYGVLVDATFLAASRRQRFRTLAEALRCPFDILALEAPVALLQHRVLGRRAAGDDASEADLEVLTHQLGAREALLPEEREYTIFVDTRKTPSLDKLAWLLSGRGS